MITLDQVSFRYGGDRVLEHLSLSLPVEGITALSGPSGCGKTTLLHLLAGLLTPQAGEITGLNPANTALLFQDDRLLPWRTAAQHIGDVLSRHKRDQIPQWLALVELETAAALPPSALSGGMARRLTLGRALALGGEQYLLDEPFTGVDPARAGRILDRIRALGTPVLLISHEEWVLRRCDRVILLGGPPLSPV